MRAPLSIVEALDDRTLLGAVFRRPNTWSTWRAVLAAAFGCDLSAEERATFTKLTGREEPPSAPVRELWCVKGRRGGGSFIGALIAAYMGAFRNWSRYLGAGERAVIPIVACDRRQAAIVLRYVRGIIAAVPMLARRVEREIADGVDLKGRVTIEVHACSFRSIRGHTVVCGVLDECAFWRNEEGSANPDAEVLAAIRPAMATIPDSLLVGISSPYARRGILWNAYRQHYGQEGDPVLVVRGATRELNPTVPQSVIDEAMEADPASAAAEYGAEFRSDLEAFVAREVVDAAIMTGRFELPRVAGARYVAFTDPSGGSCDSFTLAIAHREGERAVLDLVRERRPPFSPQEVVTEFAATLKSYGVRTVEGDKYSGEWVREAFRKNGIEYRPAERTRSEIYLELLPALNCGPGRIELLDHPRLAAQLCQLERRSGRGRDVVDHPQNAFDDLANACAGALVLTAGEASVPIGALITDALLRRLGTMPPLRNPYGPRMRIARGW